MTARALRAEDGFSLAETLVTIVLISIGFVAILTALQVSISVSASHRIAAVSDTVLRSSAELVKDRTATPYVDCATTSSYSLASVSPPAGYTAAVTEVLYWNGTLPSGAAYAPTFVASCAAGSDQGLQRLTIRVTSSDGAIQTVQVVKRRSS